MKKIHTVYVTLHQNLFASVQSYIKVVSDHSCCDFIVLITYMCYNVFTMFFYNLMTKKCLYVLHSISITYTIVLFYDFTIWSLSVYRLCLSHLALTPSLKILQLQKLDAVLRILFHRSLNSFTSKGVTPPPPSSLPKIFNVHLPERSSKPLD